MTAADTPTPPVAEMVVSRDDGSRLVAARDTPMVLVKAGRREDAVLRQAVFVTTSLMVVRPAGAEATAYRWSYKGFLQRQLCVTSISGLFACSNAEAEPLPDIQNGQAPTASPTEHPLADAALATLNEALKARADELFRVDRATHLDPILKAAGVREVRAVPPRSNGRPARGGRAAGGGSGG